MTNYLDIRTLAFVSGIIALVLSLCLFFIYATRKTYPGFRQWTIAALFNFAGMLLISLRGVIPDFFTIVAANTFIAVYFIFILLGLIDFAEVKDSLRIYFSLLAFTFLMFIYFTYYSPSVNARIAVISGIISLLCFRCFFLVNRNIPAILLNKNRLLCFTFFFLFLWFLFRVVQTVVFEDRIVSFMTAGAIHKATFIIFFAGSILITIGIIIINAQRLENDLTAASNNVKTLQKMLPICANCKKIRNDKGYWEQIETYIENHSDSKFSHGICEECFQMLYGDQDWYTKR